MMTLETPDNETTGPVVTLTSAAIKQVQRLLSRPGNDGKFLRLGVRGGGCSGLSYVLDLETESGEMDLEVGPDDARTVLTMRAGDVFHVKPTTIHRMIAVEDTDVLEVSTPELDDVVRLEDSYGRAGT